MTGCAERRHQTVLIAVPPEFRAQFFPADGLSRLAGRCQLVVHDSAQLPGGHCAARALVTSWGATRLTPRVLDRLPYLRLVAHTGATVKPFVTDAVFARGISVTQAGAGMARSVAEVALTFTLALLHQVHRYDRLMRDGAWVTDAAASKQHECLGAVIGVVGASRTGRAYIALAQALGGEILVYDPYLDAAGAASLGVTPVLLDELLRRSRVVSIHAPALPETRHLIGARELALMPDGAALINTARAGLVDERALIEQLTSGRISAALDVYDAEPLPADHVLRMLPNVLLTPHRAAGTVECRARQGEIVIDELLRHLAGEPLQHAVGPGDLSRMG